MVIAQLLTITWNEHNAGAHSAQLDGILDSIKQLREEYERRTREFSMWDSNSIGMSLAIWIYVHLKSKI